MVRQSDNRKSQAMRAITFLSLPAFVAVSLYLLFARGGGTGVIAYIIVVAYLIACAFALPILYFLIRTKRTTMYWFLLGGGLSTLAPFVVIYIPYYVRMLGYFIWHLGSRQVVASPATVESFLMAIPIFLVGSVCGGVFWLAWVMAERDKHSE